MKLNAVFRQRWWLLYIPILVTACLLFWLCATLWTPLPPTRLSLAVNEEDVCMGYAFCQLKKQPFSTNMVPFKSLFIDDLCVDKQARGQHIGESLFEYVKQQAKEQGCYEVTLNVWAGNTSAEHFYEKMGMKTKERQMEYIL